MSDTGPARLQLAEAVEDALSAAREMLAAFDVLQVHYPVTSDDFEALPDGEKLYVDGFFFRYGGLVSLLQDKLFRSVAEIEQEDVTRLSRRDFTELMEKVSAIPSARAFSEAAMFRNRLSQAYARHADRRAERLNEALERTPTLIAACNAVYRHVQERNLAPVSPGREIAEPSLPLEADDHPST